MADNGLLAAVWLVSMAGNNSEVLQLALPERMLHVDCQVIEHLHVTDMHVHVDRHAHLTDMNCSM